MKNKIYFHPSDLVKKLRVKYITIWSGACMPPDYFYKWFIVNYHNESDWTCWIDEDKNFLNLIHVGGFEMKFPLLNQ